MFKRIAFFSLLSISITGICFAQPRNSAGIYPIQPTPTYWGSIANDQVFNVKAPAYSAKGNGIHLIDGVVASGSTAFSSATASFTSADVGKVIMVFNAGATGGNTARTDGTTTSGSPTFTSAGASFVQATDAGKMINIAGAGANGGYLNTVIITVNSSTSVTLALNAQATLSGATFNYGTSTNLTTTISAVVDANDVTLGASASTNVNSLDTDYGTDDTVAIQAAITACSTAGGGTVFFPKGEYIINGAFGSNPASQIALPDVALTSPSQSIVLLGPTPQVFIWLQNVTNNNGAILLSTKNGTSGQSIIGTFGTGTVAGTHFSNIAVELKNLTVRAMPNVTNNGVDFTQALQGRGTDLVIDKDYTIQTLYGYLKPTQANSKALITPADLNSQNDIFHNITIVNWYIGMVIQEHGWVSGISIFGDVVGLDIAQNQTHGTIIDWADINATLTDVILLGSNAPLSASIINNIEIENYTNTYWEGGAGYNFNDSNSTALASITYHTTSDGTTSKTLLNGGNYLTLFNKGNNQFTISPDSGTNQAVFNVFAGGKGVYLSGYPSTFGLATYTSAGLVGTASNNLIMGVDGGAASGGTSKFLVQTAGYNSAFALSVDAGNPGNVGIGTVNPIQRFDVNGTVNPFVVTSGGNVGVGTITPGANLDVQGSARVTGLLISTGTSGAVLCLTAGGQTGHCSAASSCLSTCTCTCVPN